MSTLLDTLLGAELKTVSEGSSPASPASPSSAIRGDGGDDVSEKVLKSANPTVSIERAAWPRSVVPNSRRPLIPAEVRAKIEAIETEARVLGWPPELLWNSGFWDCPRGLAALLDAADEIAEVHEDYIAILKVKRDLLRFRRHTG